MRIAVEQWSPEYAAPFDADASQPTSVTNAVVNPDIERPAQSWSALSPPSQTRAAETVLFVDGVQRVDAIVWISPDDGPAEAARGICASYAAGGIFCDGKAIVVDPRMERTLLAPVACESIRTPHAQWHARVAAGSAPEDLRITLGLCMTDLETQVAQVSSQAEIIVIDGPLRGRQRVAGAVGYIKAHHAQYLDAERKLIVESLGPGQRTPLFLMTTSWSRYSWYMRLPGGGRHGWAGVVRCEASSQLTPDEAAKVADVVAATLPRFASQEHKDARAPQNLYPIAGLERQLRHRLGDPLVLYRALRAYSAS